jgi:hypothetical protein
VGGEEGNDGGGGGRRGGGDELMKEPILRYQVSFWIVCEAYIKERPLSIASAGKARTCNVHTKLLFIEDLVIPNFQYNDTKCDSFITWNVPDL